MLTTTHILVAGALMARPEQTKKQNLLAFFAGFVPDMSVFVMVLISRIPGLGVDNMWREPDGLYWQEPWQFFSALSNSIPIYFGLLVVAYFMMKRAGGFMMKRAGGWKDLWLVLLIFAGAGLSHVAIDFLVHADDAHKHLWPLTEWRFHSPISYWQDDHHGRLVGVIEAVGAIGLALLLWRRFSSKWARAGFVALALPSAASLVFLVIVMTNLVKF